ncbi:hypothetical protein BASA81_014280 [Batrachochytrium salamandrivorans]|nr:hypothetical protein BASA81_014280 [Batrachochytrium salamandrivorans]
MLPRLLITFLCAAAIGSVSDAFLTFEPDQPFFESVEASIDFLVKLNNKPTEDWTCQNIHEYSVRYDTLNVNGVRYTPGSNVGDHTITLPYGSALEIKAVNNDGGVSLHVDLILGAGYPSPRGLCNIPRADSPDNMLIGSDGRLYNSGNSDEVFDFTNSWNVKDEDVLTNPGARTLNLPLQQPGTVCTIPENPQPNPGDPASTILVAPTFTGATAFSSTVDFSTSTIFPPPSAPDGWYVAPTPDGYVAPTPDGYVAQLQMGMSLQLQMDMSLQLQMDMSLDVVNSWVRPTPEVKQAYLAKCRTLTDDMIRDLTKEVIDQGTKIRKDMDLGMALAPTVALAKVHARLWVCVSPGLVVWMFHGSDKGHPVRPDCQRIPYQC